MSYQSAIDQLNALAPELYTRPGQPRRKFSLEETQVLMAALGDPQRRFRSILIAGTNGKGSTAATVASILSASGVRTGLYTSPHLARANERIRVNSAEIEDEAFARLYCRVHDWGQQLVQEGQLPQLPSFFETLTAMAFLHFAESEVELAVLEVGMGGRLDATNIVDPLLSIVTDISLDHMEWLGPTIAAITREKAGILRRGGTLITLPQLPEADRVLGEMAVELGVRAVNAAAYIPAMRTDRVGPYCVQALDAAVEVDSPLTGVHQQRNVALAIAAAVELATSHGFPVTLASIATGVRETRWPGRLERIVACGREWILDVAHNPAGAWALRAALSDLPDEQRPWTLVFSCLRDKPLKEMSQILFPLFDQVIFAPIHSARAAAMEDLEAAAVALGITSISGASVCEALKLAVDRAPAGSIVISGSVYLVGEARPLLLPAEGEGQ
jgi:dihydrofolate synthase/folylpolyglutamate synthase